MTTKAANARARETRRKTKPTAKRSTTRKPRRLTLAEKIRRADIRWVGDDLEEVMAMVAATRLPSKF
ncbi:MAG TPA: hypothetical protein VG323_21370 [Thermoanaerobaculia bacterium]|nr:hypothetical protein [Thermoanaerobaculia bacterium]